MFFPKDNFYDRRTIEVDTCLRNTLASTEIFFVEVLLCRVFEGKFYFSCQEVSTEGECLALSFPRNISSISYTQSNLLHTRKLVRRPRDKPDDGCNDADKCGDRGEDAKLLHERNLNTTRAAPTK
jgi:hypothetical protein